MKKKLLFLDHTVDDVYTPIEHFTPFFDVHFDIFNCTNDEFPETIDSYSHIMVSGCVKSVLDDSAWIKKECLLLKDAIDKGKNILGVCFGHQLLALTLFGNNSVEHSKKLEAGWFDFTLLQDDELLGCKGDILSGFVYHKDQVIAVPADKADILLSSEQCAIHAFRYRNHNIWGIQAHFEIAPDQGMSFLNKSHPPQDLAWKDFKNIDSQTHSNAFCSISRSFFALPTM